MSRLDQPTAFHSAVSAARSTDAAIDSIIRQLRPRIGPHGTDLVLGVATRPHLDRFDVMQRRLRTALGPNTLMLTSAGGVLNRRHAANAPYSLSVTAMRLPGARIEPVAWEQKDWPRLLNAPAEARSPGLPEASGSPLAPHEPPRAILLIADQCTSPAFDLLPALETAYPDTPVMGGVLSGDASEGVRFLINDKLQDEGAVGVMIRGEVDVTCRSSQGCRPIGRPWVVTAAEGQRIDALGGRPPLEIIRAMREAASPSERRLIDKHGLHLGRVVNEYQSRFGRGDFLVREVLNTDPKRGAIAVSDPGLTVGRTVQFHVLDQRCIESDLALSLEAERVQSPGAPQGTLMVSCPMRGQALGRPRGGDSHLVEQALGPSPLAGLMAAEQIGPGPGGNQVHMRAASMMIFRQPEPVTAGPRSVRIQSG